MSPHVGQHDMKITKGNNGKKYMKLIEYFRNLPVDEKKIISRYTTRKKNEVN